PLEDALPNPEAIAALPEGFIPFLLDNAEKSPRALFTRHQFSTDAERENPAAEMRQRLVEHDVPAVGAALLLEGFKQVRQLFVPHVAPGEKALDACWIGFDMACKRGLKLLVQSALRVELFLQLFTL